MKKTWFLLFCLLFLFSACVSPENPTPEQTNDCLVPIRNFDYPLGPQENYSPEQIEIFETIKLPPQDWQRIANLPAIGELKLIQAKENEIVIWINTSNDFIRYRVKDRQWSQGEFITGPTSGNFIFFLDRENYVWRARFTGLNTGVGRSDALLSRYDEESDRWEAVSFLLEEQDELGIRHIEVDSQGFFWFVAINNENISRLYRFDPKTMTLQSHLDEYVVYPNFVVEQQTLLIVADNFDAGLNPGYVLIEYALDSSTIQNHYHIPLQFVGTCPTISSNLLFSLFSDNQNRVWLGTRSWLDLSLKDAYEWHVVMPDPVFISIFPGAGNWVWGEPEITAQTPDGRLWYQAIRGTGWTNPQSGEWCVFTSYRSSVLPDGYGNLWLVADDALYIFEQ
ncbi:MAG TPA: hypothetical protein PKO03_03850 [Anaerolineaceae bacterium]|nr:hypothetical protein [Anaerolineaceae bacterium]